MMMTMRTTATATTTTMTMVMVVMVMNACVWHVHVHVPVHVHVRAPVFVVYVPPVHVHTHSHAQACTHVPIHVRSANMQAPVQVCVQCAWPALSACSGESAKKWTARLPSRSWERNWGSTPSSTKYNPVHKQGCYQPEQAFQSRRAGVAVRGQLPAFTLQG